MKRHVIVILLTLALLGVLAFSVSAAPSTDPAELNKVNEAAVQMTFPTDGSNIRMTCPYCNVNSLWLPLPAATGAKGLAGHYYLSGDMTANTGYYIPYNNNVCLNLNGYSIKTTNAYAIAGKADYEFNVMGNGNVEGTGSNAYGTVFGQGTIRLFGGAYTATSNYYVVSAYADNANVYMYDGATINGKPSATSAVVSTKASNFYFYGGTINTSGTAFYLTKGTTYLAGTTVNAGGCGVYLPSGTAVIYHSAGTISGGTKRNVVMLAGTYNLTGGTISGGVTTGGNLSGLTATPGGNSRSSFCKML